MISSQKVSEIFQDCLFTEREIIQGEPIVEPIYVESISVKFGLHPERVKKHAKEIENILNDLPETFKVGWSFMNLGRTKEGELWTVMHKVCEQLMVLGIASKKIRYCSPKETWPNLPGGVPYIQII